LDHLHVAARGRLERFPIKGSSFVALPHCLTPAALKEQLARCSVDPKAQFNILIVHGVAAGMPEFSMADLGEQELPLEVMGQFSYTALGHYHNFCKVAPRAYYAGSSERLSQAEREAAKGFVEVDLEPFAVRFHEVKARRMIKLETINAAGKRGDQLFQIIKDRLNRVDSSDKIIRVQVESSGRRLSTCAAKNKNGGGPTASRTHTTVPQRRFPLIFNKRQQFQAVQKHRQHRNGRYQTQHPDQSLIQAAG
jgi:DNA repair exonuclease SbcCD nuclease subunit